MKLNRMLLGSMLLPALMLSFAACKKDGDQNLPGPDTQNPPPPPPPAVKVVSVAYGTGTVSFANTDSVIVRLLSRGKPEIIRKLTRKDTDFQADFTGIEAGDWEMRVDVYTKDAENGNRFSTSKIVKLPLTENLQIEAPDNNIGGQWKSYWLFKQDVVNLYVPLDPADPEFTLEARVQGWEFVYLHKVLKLNGHTTADADWQCEEGACFPNGLEINDIEHFKTFANNSKTVAWDSYEIHLQMLHPQSGNDVTIYRVYNRK